MTEQEFFRIMDKLVTERTSTIYNHFGANFFEIYMDASEREWYNANIAKIDRKIVEFANKISALLQFGTKYRKVADVFKDAKISSWYNKNKIKQNKEKTNN